MAPSPSKPSTTTHSAHELLVANKKATEKTYNKKLQYPLFHTSNEFYFIDDMESYKDFLSKMGSVYNKPVSRIFYVDSDNDEVPIDSEVEMEEALKLITERTDKGKFTKMRLETGNLTNASLKKPDGERKPRAMKAVKQAKPKKVAPKPKSAPLKALPKSTKNTEIAMTWKKETPSSMSPKNPTPVNKVTNFAESFMDPGISQAWMESKLKELKVELLADLKMFIAPYIQDQMKIKTLVGLIATQVAAPVGSMSPPESDHNYSAPSYSGMYNRTKIMLEKTENLMQSNQQTSDFKPECQEDGVRCLIETCDECTAECSAECTAQHSFTLDEDENLSILSGEISVTDSESDVEGTDDDFVDIPLPPCFNVIEPKAGMMLNKLGKEAKPAKTGLKMKHMPTLKTETPFLSQDQSVTYSNTNDESHEGHSLSKSILKERGEQDQETEEFCVLETMKKSNECQNSFMEKQNCAPPSEDETEENLEEIGNGGGEDFDKSYGEKYNFFSPEYQCHKYKPVSLPSNGHQAGPEHTEETRSVPQMRVPEQDENQFQDGQQKHVSPVLDVASSKQSAPSMSNTSLHNVFPGLPKPFMVKSSTHQTCYPQPLGRPLQPMTQAVQQPTQASVFAQHQQIVLAAQRANQQATQTLRELSVSQPLQQLNPFHRQQPIVTHQDHRSGNPGASGLLENLSPYNSSTTESQGKKINSHYNYYCQTGPCEKQDQASELKLWHEIQKVDHALQKWVQVCKTFIEVAPKGLHESSSTMPESVRRSTAATVTQTREDLDKLYQKFRKDVLVVSSQIDAYKQQAAGKSSLDDAIHILPTKLLQIISSTVNTTFNILGNLSKLGVMNAPSSAPSDPRLASFMMDKSNLPCASSNVSSLASTLGNMRLASQYLPYPYIGQITPATDTQSSMSFDYMNNQDYRMRPAGISSSLSAQYPYLLGSNIPYYPSNQALGQTQVHTNVQTQPPPPQPHTHSPLTRQLPYPPSQLLRPMASQLQQQVFPPVPHQFS